MHQVVKLQFAHQWAQALCANIMNLTPVGGDKGQYRLHIMVGDIT